MKRTNLILTVLAALALPAALLAQPVVSNVAFVQQPDGAGASEVVVTYDLASPNGNATVSLLYSTNGGSTFSAATIATGAVGAGVAPGAGKTIHWAVATDLAGQQLAGNFIVRVLVEDGAAIPLAITSTLAEGSVTQTATQTFTLTFAEPVTGFDASDVTVTGGTKGTFAGSGAVYTLDVTGNGGTVSATVAGGAASSVASGTTTLGDTFSNFCQDTWTLSLPGSVTMELIRIPAGSFMMGSPADELSRNNNPGVETQHPVTLTQDFYLGKTEVTQAQWLAISGSFPTGIQSHGTGAGNETRAVHSVSHNDIMDPSTGYMKLLNDHITATAQGPATATLPTEAQWEYACRAGSTTRFNYGDGLASDEDADTAGGRGDNMWFVGNSGGTQLVGQKPANAWGLRDMHGNLWERCADWYAQYDLLVTENPTGPASGTIRMIRGGSWTDNAHLCRSARRGGFGPTTRMNNVGFRVLAVR